jgi:hypothetical protein
LEEVTVLPSEATGADVWELSQNVSAEGRAETPRITG